VIDYIYIYILPKSQWHFDSLKIHSSVFVELSLSCTALFVSMRVNARIVSGMFSQCDHCFSAAGYPGLSHQYGHGGARGHQRDTTMCSDRNTRADSHVASWGRRHDHRVKHFRRYISWNYYAADSFSLSLSLSLSLFLSLSLSFSSIIAFHCAMTADCCSQIESHFAFLLTWSPRFFSTSCRHCLAYIERKSARRNVYS